jgi:hypothetical protein
MLISAIANRTQTVSQDTVTATSANLVALQLELQQDFTKTTASAHLILSVFRNSVMSRIINALLNVLPYHLDI